MYSNLFNLENGTPQGSILSPMIFLLLINAMFNNTPDYKKSIFMDDGLLWATGGDIETAINKIQNSLNAIGEWGRENGIKFSTT